MRIMRWKRPPTGGRSVGRSSRPTPTPDLVYRGWTISDRGHAGAGHHGPSGVTWTASRRRFGVVSGHRISSGSLEFLVRQIDLLEDGLDWTG